MAALPKCHLSAMTEGPKGQAAPEQSCLLKGHHGGMPKFHRAMKWPKGRLALHHAGRHERYAEH
jgi:hypothetical protein